MRIPEPISAERLAELNDFRKEKWPGFEFQRFLCIWLRAECGLSTDSIAKTLGWHVNTIRFTQKDFIKRGVSALTEGTKGGRHHSLMTKEEENELLSQFEEVGKKGNILTVSNIKSALEERMGKKIHLSTVYRILKRNNWRKITPRPSHPKKDAAKSEAFKKGALLNG
jgi:transposase